MTPIDNNGWIDPKQKLPETREFMNWQRSDKVLVFCKELDSRGLGESGRAYDGVRTAYYEVSEGIGGAWKVDHCTNIEVTYWKPIQLPKGYSRK